MADAGRLHDLGEEHLLEIGYRLAYVNPQRAGGRLIDPNMQWREYFAHLLVSRAKMLRRRCGWKCGLTRSNSGAGGA